MKASGSQHKGLAKKGLGCNKSKSLKITKQKREIAGKKSSELGGQLHTSSIQLPQLEIQDMQTSFPEAAPGDLKFVQGQFQDFNGKVKLQLFPIDEATRKALEKNNHNPHLELTLTTRKRISSVVKHLNFKWGSSKLASGELMLFPYNVSPDNLANSIRWTLEDSDVTAADVHTSLGSPAIFRLSYGWFSNLEQTACQTSMTSHSYKEPNKSFEKHITSGDKLLCMSSKGHGPCHMVDSTNQVVETHLLSEKTIQNGVDQNSSRSVNMSWVDCLSNMSFGAILSKVSETPVNLCHPLPAPNSSLQQIPITCDSFDADIASVMARHQTSNPSNRLIHSSILEAEETCHAFPFANVASSSHNHPASTRNPPATENCSDMVLSDFSGLNLFVANMLGPQVEQASLNNICPMPVTVDACSEPKSRSEDSLDGSNQVAGMNLSLSDSLGPLEYTAPCSREMNDGETIGLGELITSSMDAFQNFSIF
ncbi:tsl-kinase interacting protein [Musa troglodytarum]|uniref:Tsl-kinase interacting protein n=1 Tax=Musa troglodytarum TaxID=320322 RepID=A0A9E7EZC3_9LILI|nr:tsl-kinase interacting protein [Musa troglodytarum]URD86831.1 tsl-kinase interacting protein [Musa troglodytarum]URD86832.1 tsl-kinase interacting protein [Musa troglodytarum]